MQVHNILSPNVARHIFVRCILIVFLYLFSGYSYYQSIGMKQLYDIFKLATEELKQVPIVIDSDDLLSDPGKIRKEFHCKFE